MQRKPSYILPKGNYVAVYAMVNPAARAQWAGKVGVLEAEILDWILTRRDQELWKGSGRKATSGLPTTKGGRWLGCG